jgi:hypothetical protein
MNEIPERTIPLSELQRGLKEVVRLSQEVEAGTTTMKDAVAIMMQPPHSAPTEGFARRLLLRMQASRKAYDAKIAAGQNPYAELEAILGRKIHETKEG